MKKNFLTVSLTVLFGLLLSVTVFAQQTPPAAAQPSPQQPDASQPQTPDQAQPAQAPATGAASSQDTSKAQVFSGTIVKVGDRYVLQDSASGKSYDIDNQDVAKQHEGKRVQIQGTLDPDGKTIHLQK